MKFCTHLNGASLSVATAVWSTLAASSHAFSVAPRATQRIPVLPTGHAPFLGRIPRRSSALVLSSERDDYDDFFDDYDPSEFDSYNQNSYNDDGGVSYGGGGGRSNSYGGPSSRGGGYFSGGGYRNRGGGNRDKQRQKGRVWDYTRDTSRDQSNVDESVVEDLIRQRSEAKRDRNFEKADALRDTLLDEHHVGVDDKQRTWRTGVSRSGSGRGRFGRARSRDGGIRQPKQDFGPNGHDYHLSADCGPNASGFSDQEIHRLIAKRLNAKLARDFMQADSIQTELVARGVFIHDGIKEFRHDGRAYGDFSERRNNNRRGNPGRTQGSSRDRASYRKSSFSQDPEGIDEATVERLVEERTTYKMSRDFDRADAIREGLRSQYNILIDDRLKMWSVGGDFGDEHNARRDLAHKFASRGFIKSKSSQPLSPKNEEYVQECIDERWEAKRDRDFQTADSIRQHLLEDYQVSIDDKNKMWSVGGYFEELQGSNSPKERKTRGVYKRRGGGNLSDEEAAQIQNLIQQRYDYKYNREFEAADAIRDNLQSEFGIIIDDRAFEWRVDSEEYAPAGTGNLSESEIAEVGEKLQQRQKYRQQREYDMADSVLDDIRNTYGVTVDDRLKEWKVEREQRASWDNFDQDLDAILSEEEDEDVAEETASIESDSEDEVMESDDDDDTEVMELDDEDDDEDDDESLTEEELSKLTIPILKEKLRGAGLPVSGKKAELVARLLTSP